MRISLVLFTMCVMGCGRTELAWLEPDANNVPTVDGGVTGDGISTDAAAPETTPHAMPADLTISLASNPFSTTVVKRSTLVASVGVVLTASPRGDVLVTSLPFMGHGDDSGSWIPADLWHVITSCALFDGTVQVGWSQSPDANGRLEIRQMNVSVPRGTSKTLVLRCSTDSVVAQPRGDRYAIGIGDESGVGALNQDGLPATVAMSSILRIQAGSHSGEPPVVITVVSHGTLDVQFVGGRGFGVLVAGQRYWLTRYRLCMTLEDGSIDRANLVGSEDAASYVQIGMGTDEVARAWDVLPSGYEQRRDIDLSANRIRLPRDQCVTAELWAHLAFVQSSAAVMGATFGVARSGNRVGLAIGSDLQTGEWDASYARRLNLRTTGSISGERIYADPVGGSGTYIMRRAVPILTPWPLATTTLASGSYQDFYGFHVSGFLMRSISFQRVMYSLTITRGLGSSMTLRGFRILRGVIPEPMANVRIVDDDGNDLVNGTWDMTRSTGHVIVSFPAEQIAGGDTSPPSTYILQALVGGTVVSGDAIRVSLARDGSPTDLTGTLTADDATAVWAGGRVVGPHLEINDRRLGRLIQTDCFLWSDISEVPHGRGSIDWTGSWGLPGLDRVEVISR